MVGRAGFVAPDAERIVWTDVLHRARFGLEADGVQRWHTDYIGRLIVSPRPTGGVCAAFRVNTVSLRMTSTSTATLIYSVVVCDGSREGTATVTRSP